MRAAMSDIPDSPEAFFTEYIPARFETVKEGLAGKSSNGCMTFRIIDVGEWSMRIKDGELIVSPGMADDVVLQVTAAEADFASIFVQGAIQQEGAPIGAEHQVLAFKVLSVDEERVKLVKGIVGSVAFVIDSDGTTHHLAVTPGAQEPKLGDAECRLEVKMNDFMEMQTGAQNPMQLAMSGRIKIVGNAQIPMALSGVFV